MKRVRWLYCMEHELSLAPPDASHVGRPDLDGGCEASSLIGPAYLGIEQHIRELSQFLGDCDHWDHLGYCQTHALGPAVSVHPTRCAIGHLVEALRGVEMSTEGET